ncbi:DUF5666 domain-containing protein [Hydrocarboniphaga sp.]|uniref:DUF5666 domain-containing protein n=1 Tax=Hydrocarboniphaga sp. TaxID=2033016 RepID=UPI003D11A208
MKAIGNVIAAGSLVLLAACGGGGGSSDDDATGTAPTALVMRGTITGFGSVIVNGVHFDVSSASFQIDDHGGGQDDLSVGQVVTVAGSVDDHGVHRASEVVYGSEIRGPVQSIDLVNQRFVALGQTVVVSAATIYSGITGLDLLAVGNTVEVSGFPNAASGVLEASFVRKQDSAGEARLRGAIAALDAAQKRFAIGSQGIDYASATLDPASLTLANGQLVEVRGALGADALLHASAVRARHGFDAGEDHHSGEAEVEGLIASVNGGGSFVVNGVTVTTSSTTAYTGGSAADLIVGAKLEAEGALQSDGSLQARKIEFKTASGADGRISAAIEAIDGNASTIRLLGTTLFASSSTVYKDDRDHIKTFTFAGLAVGDWVEVGFVSNGQQLQATRIEREKADTRSEVRGALGAFNADSEQLQIAGVSVDAANAVYRRNEVTLSQAEFYAAVAIGSSVKARGSYAGGVLTASEVELENEQDDDHGSGGGNDDGPGHG